MHQEDICMGELIDFVAYKAKKDEEEVKKIDDDIRILKSEIEMLMSEMEQPYAPHIFFRGYEEMLPFMHQITSTLNSYYDSENKDEER
tara:strand:- start:2243 stop:2506 length:264 start_codon:yes stop_codon:yes gene_type:complete